MAGEMKSEKAQMYGIVDNSKELIQFFLQAKGAERSEFYINVLS